VLEPALSEVEGFLAVGDRGATPKTAPKPREGISDVKSPPCANSAKPLIPSRKFLPLDLQVISRKSS